MVVPPDSNNPPTASAAGEQPGSDLTLNAPTSAADADAVQDLRIEPEVDSSSIEPERVDIFWPAAQTADADRSWFSRLRSLRASREKKHLEKTAHDEKVTTEADVIRPAARTDEATMEAVRNADKHLASLAALRDVCARIDQRLARVEKVSGQRDSATIDEALHDLCSQMYDRLVRVEAAVQRTEGFVAEKPWDLSIALKQLEGVEEAVRLTQKSLADSVLPEVCADIERQLVQTRMALQRTEEAVADKTLHELCANIDARLGRTEDTLHRREGIVAERLQDLSARMTARLAQTEETFQRIEREGVEETLRLTKKMLADSMPPEMCVNIERQLVQFRMALQRTEDATADKTLHELCKNIDARLGRTEDTLHRNEGVVTEWLQELSADMTARFAEAEEAIRRIERIVSSRLVEQQTLSQQPSVRIDNRPVHAEETAAHATRENREPADGGVLVRAALFLTRWVSIEQMNRPIRQPWMARLAVPVLVLVAALAIGALIETSRGVTPEKGVPLTTSDQVVTPVAPATDQGIRAASTTTLIEDAPRSTRESRVSTPQPRSSDRESEPTTSRRPRFVGTLSITSVPSGASVSINGKPAGVTPLKLPGQRAGSLAVQIAHDGFERWSAAVLVPADQLTQVSAKLRATAR